MSKSGAVVLGKDFHSPNLPLLSKKQALWESHIPRPQLMVMENSRRGFRQDLAQVLTLKFWPCQS